MHNLAKIKIFRIFLFVTYPVSLIFIYPFVLFRKKAGGRLFFFFDRYVIGGAQRVHLDILESVAQVDKRVYFTRRSNDNLLKKAFYNSPNTVCRDIHFWCDNLLFRLFSVHYFAFTFNLQKQITLFSSNSTFFYDMLPFLRKGVRTIELLHNFSYGKKGMEFFGLANHRYLTKRMVIDAATRENIREQYLSYKVPSDYFERVELLEFGVEIPATLAKDYSLPVKVLYAGRGGAQKRVWLISRVAESFMDSGEPVEFHFAGTMANDLSDRVKRNAVMHGELGTKEALNKLYQECHLLILTSAFEGFPMVIKEAMAYGCVPVVTALAGNKTHLSHRTNAMLIDEIENEDQVVSMAVDLIRILADDPELMASLSENAYRYAKLNFTREVFLRAYKALLSP